MREPGRDPGDPGAMLLLVFSISVVIGLANQICGGGRGRVVRQ